MTTSSQNWLNVIHDVNHHFNPVLKSYWEKQCTAFNDKKIITTSFFRIHNCSLITSAETTVLSILQRPHCWFSPAIFLSWLHPKAPKSHVFSRHAIHWLLFFFLSVDETLILIAMTDKVIWYVAMHYICDHAFTTYAAGNDETNTSLNVKGEK